MPATNLKVRNLAKYGIINDIAPWDDPWEAWTAGTNVRFEDGRATRAPIFRQAISMGASGLSDMAGIGSFTPPGAPDTIFVFDSLGRAYKFTPGVGLTSVTEAGFTTVSTTDQFTTCYLGGVFYVNRGSHAPRYFGPASSAFAPIPNMDTPNWKCEILRAYRDFLVAFNVTKGANSYPNLVKWSDATLYGAPPGSWDTTVASNLAGENPLAQADGPIIDANNLRDDMLIYTPKQIWRMSYTGDKTYPMIFNRLWSDERWGAMSRNCSIEVDGLHYVFGKQDFYIHDGTSKPQSIADGRVRNSVFGSINLSAAKQCFIAHDPYQHEVLFCYQSSDSDVRFPGAAYCNKAAVWNYRSGTFSFRELPNVRAWTVASVSTVNTWATDPPTKTWANSGGSWLDQNDGAKPALLLTGNTLSGLLTDARIYAVDPVFRGSRVILPVDTEANTPAYLEHGGVDLDEADIPLQVYKWVRNVYPQVRVVSGGPVTIRVGAAALNSLSPTYVSAKQFNPATDYQISARASGRYIALRVEIPTLTDFDITGFDLEVLGGGRR